MPIAPNFNAHRHLVAVDRAPLARFSGRDCRRGGIIPRLLAFDEADATLGCRIGHTNGFWSVGRVALPRRIAVSPRTCGRGPNVLVVTVHNIRQRVRFPHDAGPLVLGRRPDPALRHLVVDDAALSARHLRIEAVSASVVRIENLTDADISVHDAAKLRPGVPTEIRSPARLRIGNTDVEIAAEAVAETQMESSPTRRRSRQGSRRRRPWAIIASRPFPRLR